MNTTEATNVTEYIAEFPDEVQGKMKLMRSLIQQVAPEATESIAYHMPAYKLNKKPLVYFGGFANHIGFYATPVTHEHFKDQLSGYKNGKGSVQFPHSEPLPEQLIKEMIQFKVNDLSKASNSSL